MARLAANRNTPAQANGSLAFSIGQFCALHAISTDFYFKLQRQGLGPTTMKVGGRTLISQEAAADWRRAREVPRETKEKSADPPVA
jgi:hypothetical protein